MSDNIYFHIWDNHFKMWGYKEYLNNNNNDVKIILYYGRIQKDLEKLRNSEKIFIDNEKISAKDEAKKYIRSRIRNKLRKGYIPINNSIYQDFATGNLSMDEFIAYIEKRKKLGIKKEKEKEKLREEEEKLKEIEGGFLIDLR